VNLSQRLAVAITSRVGTMACAGVFAALSLVSLPAALASGSVLVMVGWLAQTFLQLVLLPIIMVGQQVTAAGTEAVIRETHDTVMLEHAELRRALDALQRLQ
jgi:hypothetical protein